MKRRDFLKLIAMTMAPLGSIPVQAFVPPRNPFVQLGLPGLMGLVSHLGVLPVTPQLNICDGRVLDIKDWDGTGYPCLVENACCFGSNSPRAWIYDFDLWNFRHDDHLGVNLPMLAAKGFNSWAAFYAARRFGDYGVVETVRHGGGWLMKEFCGLSHRHWMLRNKENTK